MRYSGNKFSVAGLMGFRTQANTGVDSVVRSYKLNEHYRSCSVVTSVVDSVVY